MTEAKVPLTVNSYLDQLDGLLAIDENALGVARGRRAAIEEHLLRENCVSLVEGGSLTRCTGLWPYSHVDYFVRSLDDHTGPPSDALQRIMASMGTLYPDTLVAISGHAVKLLFASGMGMTLVPMGSTAASRKYKIPDPFDDSRWILSAPENHLLVINEAQIMQPEIMKVVRLLKLWKANRRVPVSSFYLETRAVQFLTTRSFPVTVSEGVRGVMTAMWEDRTDSILDAPLLGECVSPTPTASMQSDCLSKLRIANSNLLVAAVMELSQNFDAAIAAWKRVLE